MSRHVYVMFLMQVDLWGFLCPINLEPGVKGDWYGPVLHTTKRPYHTQAVELPRSITHQQKVAKTQT